MSDQVAAEAGAGAAKTDGPMPKPPKLSKYADKSKSEKKKEPKTSFSGRVDEIGVGESETISFVLKDKRGKRHQFTLANGSVPRLLLLTSAMASKSKCHIETSATDQPLVRTITLHGKK